MNVPRETIAAAFVALFGGLAGGSPFQTISRVFQVPANIDAGSEPALFIVEEDESINEKQAYGLGQYEFPFRLVIFAQMPDVRSGTVPGSILNPLIDAVDAAVNPFPGCLNNLGGIVVNCFINGRIMKAEGYLGAHVVAAIPVTILTGA